ncbi:Uncharacterised protein [Vibrio cholerae]|nr:Uncharacterised protein [Vibrio cholerae]
MVTDKVDLLDLSGNALSKDKLKVSTVARQWGYHRFHGRVVFTHAVVKIF